MRTFADRLRHTVLFEAIALALVATVGSWITGHSIVDFGTLGLMFSGIAMGWNMLFNWLFDHWEARYRPGRRRDFLLRAIHATLFELVLLFVGIFLISWWLNVGYAEAFLMDISLSAFFVVYAFAFNWTYDVVFPVPRPHADATAR